MIIIIITIISVRKLGDALSCPVLRRAFENVFIAATQSLLRHEENCQVLLEEREMDDEANKTERCVLLRYKQRALKGH